MRNKKYKTSLWLSYRERVLRRDGYKCQECKRYGKTVNADTVHHIRPAEDYPELFYNTNNLMSVCRQCHNKYHDRATGHLTALGYEVIERYDRKFKNATPPL